MFLGDSPPTTHHIVHVGYVCVCEYELVRKRERERKGKTMRLPVQLLVCHWGYHGMPQRTADV